MALHARPHLETHSRGAGHSAIAGVAYRLGLRLYDRRTGVWHDYRRRKIGEEIVRSLTVAPEGAPAWVTDPEELWNRAEAAERRKDAQVARDYRIPVPFGLSDQQAGDLAEDMARFICRELHTAVSLGLHRDADADALGNVKPPEKQGFHAHLYFPTRRLEEIQQDDGTSAWGLGAKLILLSNKNTSGAFVERLNEHWAELANRYTAASNLPADYTHLSYARQDLPITPQPTLGAAVTAMERRGFFTRRGDALRGDILVPSLVYEAAHTIVLQEQHRQAKADVQREAAQPVGAESPSEPCQVARQPDATRAPAVTPASAPATDPLIPLLEGAPGSLLTRFREKVPAPEEPEARRLFAQVLRLVRVIEKVLGVLVRLVEQLRDHQVERDRREAAAFMHEDQHRERRAARQSARQRLAQWEASHPWRLRTATVMGEPTERQRLHREVKRWDELTHEAQAAARHVRSQIATFDQEGHQLRGDQREQLGRLGGALDSVRDANADWVLALRNAASAEEQDWIKSARPVLVREDWKTVEPALRQPALEHRPRMGRTA
ncbi:MAG: hypothetical protein RSP_09920 [Rhodanobacter sp.]